METIAIERSIWINAPPERVWAAITDPEQIEAWFAPGISWRLSALAVGGRLYARHPETGAEMYPQILAVVDPPQKLVLRSQPEADSPEAARVTTWTLHEEKGGTRLTVHIAGYEQEPEATRQQLMDDDGSGYDRVLGNIKAVIEGTSLPQPQGFGR